MQAVWLDRDESLSLEDLRAEGVHYEALPMSGDAYQKPLDALAARNGYVQQDVVALTPETPNLDIICAKFIDEHTHDDDEVRFVLGGEGIFDIRSRDDQWMRVKIDVGDLIVVPAGRNHRFLLTEQKTIRCVRLFKDASGWIPHYRKG